MATTLDQYREAKSSYLKLRNQAKKELLARFHEVASELLQIQRELLEDFGEKVSLPAKGKKPRAVKHTEAKASPAGKTSAAPAAPSPKAAALQKQIEKQSKKLTEARAANKPTKALEDRLYELEDELRLLDANG